VQVGQPVTGHVREKVFSLVKKEPKTKDFWDTKKSGEIDLARPTLEVAILDVGQAGDLPLLDDPVGRTNVVEFATPHRSDGLAATKGIRHP
jgi:hypothetical protein